MEGGLAKADESCSSGNKTLASDLKAVVGTLGAVAVVDGGLLDRARGSSLFESDCDDLLRLLALQKMLRNFLPNTNRTTMKAVAITIMTITKGILAAP